MARSDTDIGVYEIERGKRYKVVVEAGRDPNTGKRKQLSQVVYGSRREARRVRDELKAKVGDSSWLRSGMTVAELWGRIYLPDIEGRLAASTVEGYRRNYANFVEAPLGRLRLRDLTPMSVKMWLSGIDGGKRRYVAFGFLRTMLNRAVRWDLMPSNPCDRVEPPKKVDDHEPVVLTAEEAAAYLEAFRGSPVEAAVLVAIGCGLRRSEIAALCWGDLRGGSVSVETALTAVNGEKHEGDTKTKFSRRSVALPPSIWARLMEIRGDAPASAPLMPDGNGNRMNPDNLSHLYVSERDRLVPEWAARAPLRDLRHTSLTLALEGGADLITVSRRAGHSSVTTTSNYYIRPDKRVDEEAADGLDALLGGRK